MKNIDIRDWNVHNRSNKTHQEVNKIIDDFLDRHIEIGNMNKFIDDVQVKVKLNDASVTFSVYDNPEFKRMLTAVEESSLAVPIKIINDTEIFYINQKTSIPMVGLGILIVKDKPDELKTVRSDLFEEVVDTLYRLKVGRNIEFHPTPYQLSRESIKKNWWSVPVSDLQKVVSELNLVFRTYQRYLDITRPYIRVGAYVNTFLLEQGLSLMNSWS